MDKKNPNRNRIYDILKGLNENLPDEPPEIIGNSHILYNHMMKDIRFEKDINKIRDAAEYYFDLLCMSMPDSVATNILKEIVGMLEE